MNNQRTGIARDKVMDEYIALIGYINKKRPSPICATEVRTYWQELKSARIKVEQEISARHSHQIHQQISKSLIRMITNYGPILPHITPR